MAEKKDYYTNDYGYISSNQMVETPKGRLIWANLRKPSKMNQKYSFTILFPKDQSLDKDTKTKLKAIKAIGEDLLKYAGKNAKGYKFGPIQDGDNKAEQNENFAGCWYITATSRELPQLVDIDKERIAPEDFANGMIVKGVVQPAYFNSNGKGICYSAFALMLVKDDDVRFRGAVDGVSAFSEEDGDDKDTDEDLDEPTGEDEEESETESDDELDEDEEESEDEEEEEEKPAPKKKAAAPSKPAEKAKAPKGMKPAGKKSPGATLNDIL